MFALPVLREMQHLVGLPPTMTNQHDLRRPLDRPGYRLVEGGVGGIGVMPMMVLGLSNMVVARHLTRCVDTLRLDARLVAAGPHSRLISHDRNRHQSAIAFAHGQPPVALNLSIYKTRGTTRVRVQSSIDVQVRP